MTETKRHLPAISAKGLSKTYKLYDSVTDQVVDVMRLGWLFFWRKISPRPFPALSDINVNIAHGERVGIIGQNGAGKTTFLKIITGAISATGGVLAIDGDIQALMQVGLGFHPEFTGRENIKASLLYSGLPDHEKRAAEQDVIDFCELGQFLDQPLKTYSLGMQSRLQFACATAIKPDILIVDEVLGAGDAYFSMKSSARMEKLTKSGCTLLLVSHSMGQVLQFCNRVVWIADGKIKRDGPALEVVKAFEQWMHERSLNAGLINAGALRTSDRDEKRAVPTGGDPIADGAGEPVKTEVPDQSGIDFDESARWKTGDAALQIYRVSLLDGGGRPRTVFEPDTSMTVKIQIKASKTGEFPCAIAVRIYSEGGESVLWTGSESQTIKIQSGDVVSAELHLEPILLNSGRFSASIALFDRIVPENKAAGYRYDLVSRSFEFAITNTYDGNDSLFRHPVRWSKLSV